MPRGISRVIFTSNKVNVLALKVLLGFCWNIFKDSIYCVLDKFRFKRYEGCFGGEKKGDTKGLAYRRFRLHLMQ